MRCCARVFCNYASVVPTDFTESTPLPGFPNPPSAPSKAVHDLTDSSACLVRSLGALIAEGK